MAAKMNLLQCSPARLVIPALVAILFLMQIGTAQAVPAFARKYQANCALCHSNEPRLTPFGQRFLANGYQFPGTADGDTAGKIVLDGAQGPVTLDRLSNMVAARIRADISKSSFDSAPDSGLEDMSIDVPAKFNFFVAGTATKNLSYFVETEVTDVWSRERAFLQFSNLGAAGRANVKVGHFDPSFLFSFPTHRQQMNPIGPEVVDLDSNNVTTANEIYRIPVVPLAFTYKFYGLLDKDGSLLLPFEPSLYNAPVQNGISVHGRPLGGNDGLLYQIGITHNETANGEQRQDTYGMLRYDMNVGEIAAQLSGFYYNAPDAARLMMAGTVTDITRTGIGARAQWDAFDVYGAYVMDSIDVPAAAAANWEDSASALSLEGDWRLRPDWMLAARYDQMSAGGMNMTKGDASFLGLIAKYYPSPNIGLYVRYHMNLEGATANANFASNVHAATNLQNTMTLGVDMGF